MMQIQTIPISKIKRAKYNPRKTLKPGDPEYEKLKRSMTRFGFLVPLVWNERSGVLVGGHQRLTILEEEGAKEVTVSVVDLDETSERVLNVALNNIEGEWDEEILVHVLTDLQSSGVDLQFTGFDTEEIEQLLEWSPEGIEFTEYDADHAARVIRRAIEQRRRRLLFPKRVFRLGRLVQLIPTRYQVKGRQRYAGKKADL